MEETRINKYLSAAGVCSRREADREIEKGNVLINGRPALPGDRVSEGMEVIFCGRKVTPGDREVLIAFNKPKGIVCTSQKREKDNIIDYINYPVRIYPVGRLDKDSEGLILLTNQGDLVNKISRAGNYHEKEYIALVNRDVTEDFLSKLRRGVYLKELDVKTRPCRVWKTGAREFHIVLTQGYNRQIRRMCEACGFYVRGLKRIRIMNIELGNLKTGAYRSLTGQEIRELKYLIRDSYSAPYKGKDSAPAKSQKP